LNPPSDIIRLEEKRTKMREIACYCNQNKERPRSRRIRVWSRGRKEEEKERAGGADTAGSFSPA
jgi:hypothetical protein